MPQLLVRNLEPAVFKKLRRSAATQGVSVEEAHRRLLRSALTGSMTPPAADFLAYLRSIPPDEEIEFPRQRDLPRKAVL